MRRQALAARTEMAFTKWLPGMAFTKWQKYTVIVHKKNIFNINQIIIFLYFSGMKRCQLLNLKYFFNPKCNILVPAILLYALKFPAFRQSRGISNVFWKCKSKISMRASLNARATISASFSRSVEFLPDICTLSDDETFFLSRVASKPRISRARRRDVSYRR